MWAGEIPTTSWVVVLEFSAVGQRESQPTIAEIVALLESLGSCDPVSLYDPERYAVQIRVEGSTAARALGRALAKHERAAASLGLAELPLVRADVMTPDELAHDLAVASGNGANLWSAPVYDPN